MSFSKAGVIQSTRTEARQRLSVLLTVMGRVSLTRLVPDLGIKWRSPRLKSPGGGWPSIRWRIRSSSKGAATSTRARYAAKGMPSGPAEELFEFRIARVTSSIEGF